MSAYMTEEEQIENIKKWWARHGTKVTALLSIILLSIAGYRYMHWHHEKVRHQASAIYEQMMNAFSNQDIKSVRSYANELTNGFEHSVYADAAHMTLAKIYVSKNKWEEATQELKKVADESNMPALKQVASIRMARLLAEQKSYTQALTILNGIKESLYLPVINELKGDIYGAMGEYQNAQTAYKQALEAVKLNGMSNLFLEMKSNELSIKSQSEGHKVPQKTSA